MISLTALLAFGHGAIVTPRSRNSVDYLVGVSGIDTCFNVSSESYCENGQGTVPHRPPSLSNSKWSAFCRASDALLANLPVSGVRASASAQRHRGTALRMPARVPTQLCALGAQCSGECTRP